MRAKIFARKAVRENTRGVYGLENSRGRVVVSGAK